jgi:hypothetical protein
MGAVSGAWTITASADAARRRAVVGVFDGARRERPVTAGGSGLDCLGIPFPLAMRLGASMVRRARHPGQEGRKSPVADG